MIRWERAKDPTEDYANEIDWAVNASLGDDTIAGSVFTLVNDVGLVIESQDFTDTTATLKLSGGLRDRDAEIRNVITTAGGDTFVETIKLRIRKR